ncbi:MAG: histidine kinase [Eubacterium sp.]|nr:histidine kinase [Eubacterium sp.]
MHIPKHRTRRTLAYQVKMVLVVLVTVLVIYTMGSIYLLQKESERTVQEIDQLTELYTNELDSGFLRISRKLFSTIMERNQPGSEFWNYVEMMTDESYVEYPIKELREMFFSGTWEYGEEYVFFLYLDKGQQFYQLSLGPDALYTGDKEVEQAVIDRIADLKDIPYSVKKKWTIVSSGDRNYICKVAQNQGVYLGCYVNVESILEPFSNVIMGDGGYVRLVDENDESVGMITAQGISYTNEFQYESSRYAILKQLSQAPFSIEMKISGDRILDVMVGSIIILIALAAILILADALILIYLRRNILMPVKRFTQNLEKYDDGNYVFSLTEGNLLELEQIDDKFKHMIHQIRKLKITLYEQELEKQKVEMDYLKLQIRPHFYLNCLNFIYSMIDFGEYDHARQMSKITADYLSYIFRNTSEMVSVSAETEHCQNYLKILLLRYPNRFDYYVEVHEEVQDASILPFLIQVFVENTAQHALTLEEKILISVTVYPEDREEGKYVNIYISDTGKGFPEPILRKLQQGEGISEKGKHVGITNCVNRFRRYYGEKGEINFDNSPLGGAIVDIHIPYSKYKG